MSNAKTDSKTLPASDEKPWEWVLERKGNKVSERLMPRVGVGASFGHGSDCYPYTIVAVSKSGHQITLRPDDCRVVSGNFMEGNAVCEFTPREVDPANYITATRRRNLHRCGNCGSITRMPPSDVATALCDRTIGCREVKQSWLPVYREKGRSYRGQPSIGIGYRRYYQDPHF